MQATVIKIGNSRGIRLPKSILEQCRFEDTVSLRVQDNELIVSAGRKPREGWETELAQATAKGDPADDFIHINDTNRLSSFDEEEWTW